MKKIVLLIILWLLAAQGVWAASEKKAVKQGNALYEKKEYAQALEKYNEALDKNTDSPLINFNIGTALYQKGEYEKAVEAFVKALITDDIGLEARANYNIGNAKYRQGEFKKDADLAGVVEFYKEALDYYKRAMELDEDFEEAKFNHNFVERKLKVLLDEISKQQQEPQECPQQEEGEEEKSEGSSQGEMDEKEADAAEQAGEEGAEQSERESVDDGVVGEEGGQQEIKDTEKLTEEQARMLLEGYAQEELESIKEFKDKQRVSFSPVVGKDW